MNSFRGNFLKLCAAGLIVLATTACRGNRTVEGLHSPDEVDPVAEPAVPPQAARATVPGGDEPIAPPPSGRHGVEVPAGVEPPVEEDVLPPAR